MIRYRKYRVFVAFAFVAVIALWHFNNVRRWQPTSILSSKPADDKQPTANTNEQIEDPSEFARESHVPTAHVSAADRDGEKAKESLPSIPEESKPVQAALPSDALEEGLEDVDDDNIDEKERGVENAAPKVTSIASTGQQDAMAEVPLPLRNLPSKASAIHWSSMPEHFPVSSTIQLPEGSPKPIPKIQHEFAAETEEDRLIREERLGAIKGEFLHAWTGYRENAWLNDELMPVSGKSKNPFCGWAATLVDSLDTLWIMGMKEDFENALKAVETIDFTTSIRNDIPLFETVIRYLGGLLAAYDVSGGTYTVLLDKAVELADILMGAFDTPNRMPVTYYHWKPAFASRKQFSGTSVVLAELGSLSVEFTRLAQATLEPKYYDAVARITDALEEWQDKTRVPGMWPIFVDASGCQKQNLPSLTSNERSTFNTRLSNSMKDLVPDEEGSEDTDRLVNIKPLKESNIVGTNIKETNEDEGNVENAKTNTLNKRQFYDLAGLDMTSADIIDNAGEDSCVPQGLSSLSSSGSQTFTLAGQSDSTYEYLPKQYLLLGGLVEKYRTMYEKAANAFIEKLFFRPMTEDNLDILISGDFHVSGKGPSEGKTEHLPQNSHLTCFVGGMVAMAAKIFERDGDLELASKITNGCIWSYDSTTTGIMPEEFLVMPCADRNDCQWNETKWRDELDPYSESRKSQYERQVKAAQDRAEREANVRATRVEEVRGKNEELEQVQNRESAQQGLTEEDDQVGSSQLADDEVNEKVKRDMGTEEKTALPQGVNGAGRSGLNQDKTDLSSHLDYSYHIRPPSTHEEFVEARIREERLPKGFTKIKHKNYILRPEAIESVYYMYRITGDPYWREAGWRMFTNICAATRVAHGHSAIDDVTKTVPRPDDSMESFWLAETLKYFYLLFSPEDVISLDEWVFNTEAHPMRRPIS